jgi:hypothetical protein
MKGGVSRRLCAKYNEMRNVNEIVGGMSERKRVLGRISVN